MPRSEANIFNEGERASGIYYLKRDEDSLLSARQESVMWKFNDRGEPQEFGGIIMDGVRMIASGFNTSATSLTLAERREANVPRAFQYETLERVLPQMSEQDASRHVQTHDFFASLAERFNKPKEDEDSDGYFYL